MSDRAKLQRRLEKDQAELDHALEYSGVIETAAWEERVEALKLALDEGERCALLCEMRGGIARKSAAMLRGYGSYTGYSLWPLPFKRITIVAPKWEKAAQEMDAVADAFDSVAKGCRKGWDPRKVEKK